MFCYRTAERRIISKCIVIRLATNEFPHFARYPSILSLSFNATICMWKWKKRFRRKLSYFITGPRFKRKWVWHDKAFLEDNASADVCTVNIFITQCSSHSLKHKTPFYRVASCLASFLPFWYSQKSFWLSSKFSLCISSLYVF